MTVTFDTHLTSLTHLFEYLNHFEAYQITHVSDAIYQVPRPAVYWFRRRRYMGMAAILVL